MENFDRRTLVKATGGSLLVPLAGCIDPAETLADLSFDPDGDTITATQELDSRKLRSLQMRFKWRSMYTDETGTLKTFSESELTKNDNTYTAELPKDQIFEDIPTEEPVDIVLESTLGDYTKTSSYEGLYDYYMLKYQADGTTHTVDKNDVMGFFSTEEKEENTSKIYQWETDDTLQFKMLYISPLESLELDDTDRLTYNFSDHLPFLFTLSISKEKQQALNEYRDSLSMITWREFQQEVSVVDETFHYYEQDMVTDFATQIKTQLNNYGINKTGADLQLALGVFDKFIEYDFGGMRNPEYNLRFFSQILEDQECICRGTSFGIASVAYQLGYDVGLQALVEPDKYEFPGAYHMEPTVVIQDTEMIDEEYKQSPRYKQNADEFVNGVPSDITHSIVYPGRPIRFVGGLEKTGTKRVQFDYLTQA